MGRIGDPRWGLPFTLGTFVGQLILTAVVLGLSATNVTWDFYGFISLAAAALSVLSIIIYLICYFTSTLHPLVVLTLSIEFMILWLAAAIMEIIGYVFTKDSGGYDDDYYDDGQDFSGCSAPTYDPNDWQGYSGQERQYNYTTGTYEYTGTKDLNEYKDWYDSMRAAQKSRCGEGTALVVFVVLCFVSYIWLITFAAVTRNRTKMPFVKAEKQPLMAEQRQEQAAMTGAAEAPMDEERASPSRGDGAEEQGRIATAH